VQNLINGVPGSLDPAFTAVLADYGHGAAAIPAMTSATGLPAGLTCRKRVCGSFDQLPAAGDRCDPVLPINPETGGR
jgi:hypothetical protein